MTTEDSTEDSTENMPECTQCPHVIGDYTERDCGFPDCMGGWESAYKALQAELDRRVAEAEERQREKDAKICDDYPLRDPAEDGNGYWAAEECANQIRNAGGKGDE